MRTVLRFAGRRARQLVLVGVAISLAIAVVLQWSAIESFEWRLSWPTFLGAVVLFSIGPVVGGTTFWLLLRELSPTVRFSTSLSVWGRSFAARFIPFGAMTVAVRMVERERLGASRSQMLTATAYEQLVAAAAAALVGLACLTSAGRTPPVVAILVLAGVLLLVAASQPVARWWLRQRVGRADGIRPIPRARALFGATVLSASGWLVAGAAVSVFTLSLTAGSAPDPAFLLGAYAVAWLAGFVVPFAPSGLGVREATFVALLAPEVGVGPATALAVALRLANVAGDLVAVGGIEAVRLARRRWRGRVDRVVWEAP